MYSKYKTFIIAFLIYFPLTVYSQVDQKFEKKTRKIVVVGYMDSVTHYMGVPCGIIESASIYRITIEYSSSKLYHKGTRIYIYILCPKDYGDNYFFNGGKYRFVLSTNMKVIKGIAINNKNEFSKIKVSGFTDSIKLIHR